jgi:hypothetical protein
MGYEYPTLLQLRHSYNQLMNSQAFKYCAPLASAILADLQLRFHDYYTFAQSAESACLATITHPEFKLRWLKDRETAERMRLLFLNTLKLSFNADVHSIANHTTRPDASSSSRADFFSFIDEDEDIVNASTQPHAAAELEGLVYVDKPDRSIISLIRFPKVLHLFQKFNVSLPSSAPVERLFSIANLIATVRRNRLKPKLFETLLLQRVNDKIE